MNFRHLAATALATCTVFVAGPAVAHAADGQPQRPHRHVHAARTAPQSILQFTRSSREPRLAGVSSS